jgi:hypothetical protein
MKNDIETRAKIVKKGNETLTESTLVSKPSWDAHISPQIILENTPVAPIIFVF